jgi:PPM family protein phosphatase
LSATELVTEQAERSGALAHGGLAAAARTNRGAVRSDNQDAYLCAIEDGLFAVIDGMGGQKGGRTAAALARDALREAKDPLKGLARANERIYEAARADRELDGMGCVASAVRLEDGLARIAHVGDTRVYLAGSAGCEQLTCDHTVAASMQEKLGLDNRGARELGGRNQVMRDIGGKPREGTRWIDTLEVPLEQGALLLLCSDGLYDSIGADDLYTRLRGAQREQTEPSRLVDALIEKALERGAKDNITALVVRQQGPVKPRAAAAERPSGATAAAPAPEKDDRDTTAPVVAPARARARSWILAFFVGLTVGVVLAALLLP